MKLDHADFHEIHEAFKLGDRMLTSKICLLMDSEGKINAEYSKYMKAMAMGKKLLPELMKSCMYYSGKPTAACADALESDGFDPSDVPYVGVAQNGNGVFITHEEKHLATARCAIVESECNVRIVGTEDVPSLLC